MPGVRSIDVNGSSELKPLSSFSIKSALKDPINANIVLIRGLPGSGKTSLADMIDCDYSVATDDFFMVNGVYQYDRDLLSENHGKCAEFVKDKISRHYPIGCNIVIHNTFSERWEMQVYIELANDNNYNHRVIDLFDAGLEDKQLEVRNEHSVREEDIFAMRERWEHQWRDKDTRPPWERDEGIDNE